MAGLEHVQPVDQRCETGGISPRRVASWLASGSLCAGLHDRLGRLDGEVTLIPV